MTPELVHQIATGQKPITVVGGGLAGSECALQLAKMGYLVDLYEMRPLVMTEAHKTPHLGELVCSNSFGSLSHGSAPAQLKWEAQALGSHVLRAALEAQVPAGQALGMDREVFARAVTAQVKSSPRIRLHSECVESLDQIPRPAVIATGPLTHLQLSESLQKHFGDEFLYFFDAIAPIIDADSIDMDIAWKADRYDKGTPDYINCPLNREQYETLIREIESAQKIEPKHFETTAFFEGCMPIETMVARGPETLRFGPMKPVGLRNPKTGREMHAIVQLRQDNKEGTAYNMVGFQTRMAYGEQARVFRMIPGLEKAEFLKLGSIHRNLFINSPRRLNKDLSSQKDPWLFFAGQITGVEGYFESTSIGLLVARFLDQKIRHNEKFVPPPRDSMMGSLLEAITDPSRAEHFQPTNVNFGLFRDLKEENGKKIRDKKLKKLRQVDRAQKAFSQWLQEQGWAQDQGHGLKFLSAEQPQV
ncbi:MAG: methylenetetrahydrofolate--tRNA-(uracil(54)-C(5))-methyltransferase (FADH(2)-oxidizing) TrmFO [Pseudobdellovibrionaceae bacterium]